MFLYTSVRLSQYMLTKLEGLHLHFSFVFSPPISLIAVAARRLLAKRNFYTAGWSIYVSVRFSRPAFLVSPNEKKPLEVLRHEIANINQLTPYPVLLHRHNPNLTDCSHTTYHSPSEQFLTMRYVVVENDAK